MKTLRIYIRVDEKLKQEIEKASTEIGLNTSSYLIYLHKKNIKNN